MDDLEVAVAAARAGGAIVRDGFARSVIPKYKRQFDPVTATDHSSEAAVLSVITERRPDDAILAEESGGIIPDGRLWIVDPLDGTVNFVHGIPQISVSVALWEGDRPLAGVIYDPLRDECFSASADGGAYLNQRPIKVSPVESLERSVAATGFPYDHGDYADEYAQVVGAVLASVNGIRRFGSAALDLAWVAAGRYDAFWERELAAWDIAAGMLLVREAGGMVGALSEGPVLDSGNIVAANAQIFDEFNRLLAEV